jgi:spore maturation protein CgeB
MPSELHRWCFEPSLLDRLGEVRKPVDVSFVGTLFRAHASRQRWLDYVCRRTQVEIWAHDIDGLPKNSPIFDYLRGTAWGAEMYRILRGSLITLNHHIDMAQSYANNMRLFEATGVGTLLITDWKQNLEEMFDPGKEVAAYRSPQECVEFVQYYLEHESERAAIAQAGQQRTLRDHTYYHRAQELADIVRKRL